MLVGVLDRARRVWIVGIRICVCVLKQFTAHFKVTLIRLLYFIFKTCTLTHYYTHKALLSLHVCGNSCRMSALKWLTIQKWKLSFTPFIHPHIVPNLHVFLFFCESQKKVFGRKQDFYCRSMEKNVLFFSLKISSFVFQRRKKGILHVWNEISFLC